MPSSLLAALFGFFCLLAHWACAMPSFQELQSSWRPSEAVLLDRHGRPLQDLRLDFKVRRLAWTTLAQISKRLPSAIVMAEDRRFFEHRGVDGRAVLASIWGRFTGRPPRGASTLTMQLAALLEPGLEPSRGRRTLTQKWAQMRAAWRLEATWSKQEILEAYLNLVSFRGEFQGVAAVAWAFFGKQPAGLSESEALVLAAMLPSPNATATRIGNRACALAQASRSGLACAGLQDLALRVLGHPPTIVPGANAAPHLAKLLLKTPGERLATTLDEDVQRVVGEALGQQLYGLADRNVRDGAALVVDNATGDVLAYVGSAGPFSRAGEVDGVRAKRQAGSTLKPFLYGLALEKRYLTPASILDDAPIHLETSSGLYIPQNYDHDFKGRVSVRTALASSLNVPAVRTLVLVGVEAFRDRLWDLGYHSISQSGEYYGYSLALGSADVSLLEQINAYRSLANGGVYSPLRMLPSEPVGKGRRVMDESAAFLVGDILADPAGRAVTFGLSNPLTTRFWSAVKTGTSKDMRDNWCIGYSRRYTVGVWVGNFEGDAMRDVSGVTGAAPAWLEIMNALHENQTTSAPAAPVGVVRRDLRFEPAVEPPRGEWFVRGTESALVVLAEEGGVAPRIETPADGVVIALDPDIPYANQVVWFTSRSAMEGLSFVLDGKFLAKATVAHQWRPTPGIHELQLVGKDGKPWDAIHFTVRALNP